MRRGLSLLELVVSSFLLLTGIFILIALFDASLQRQRLSSKRAQAARLAETRMNSLRAWAHLPVNFDSDWSTVSGLSTEGDFQVQIQVAPRRPLYSPCESLEKPWGNDACRFDRSLVAVHLQVLQGPQVWADLTSEIGEPIRNLDADPVRISSPGGSAPIPPDGSIDLAVSLQDSQHRPIPDVTFHWLLLPVTGNGTLEHIGSRLGTSVRVLHRVQVAPWSSHWKNIPGLVRVIAQTRYGGRLLESEPYEITLAP